MDRKPGTTLGSGEPAPAPSSRPPRAKRGVPEGLWQRCPGCGQTIYRGEAEKRLGVCPECEYHFYVTARERIRQVLDEGTFEEWCSELMPADPLEFKDKKPYREKLVAEQKRTGLTEAAVVGSGMIRARRVAFGVTDSAFIMGSMGSVVGEKLTRLGNIVPDADGQSVRGARPL
jgi:acetyl-CoA carboxylase carboxyl transferase subunit beta